MKGILIIAFSFALLLMLESEPAHANISPVQRARIDSLKKSLLKSAGSARVDCLNRLSYEYGHADAGSSVEFWSPDSAKIFAWQAMDLSKKIGYTDGMGEAWLNLSILAQESDFLQAEKYARSATSIFEKSGNTSRLAAGFFQLASSLYMLGKYEESRYFAAESLNLTSDDKNGRKAILFRLIALNWRMQGIVDTAFCYELKEDSINNIDHRMLHSKANFLFELAGRPYEFISKQEKAIYSSKQIPEKLADIQFTGDFYEEKATVFARINKKDSADFYYQQYRKQAPHGNFNIALIYLFQKQYEIALKYFQDYLEIKKKQHDYNQTLFTTDNIAQCFFAQQNFSASLRYARELVDLCRQSRSRYLLQNGYKLIWKVYQQLRKPDSAYSYFAAYSAIKDSLRDIEFNKNEVVFELRSRAEQQKSSIALLNEENQLKENAIRREKIIRNVIIGIFLLGMCIAFLIFRHARLNRKKELAQQLVKETQHLLDEKIKQHQVAQLEIEKTQLEMKVLRMQMNPHFIFNSLNSINRFILQNNREQASQYLTKFSKLVRMILQNTQANLISLESELESLELYLDLESLRFNYHFSYSIHIQPEMDISAIIVPPLIIQPFAENAIWHGLMHKEEKGELDIRIWLEGEHVFLKIRDNGIGRKQSELLASKSATRHKSMGLKITAQRIALMQPPDMPIESPIIINDLVDPEGEPAGTEVIIKTIALYD